MGWWAIDDTKSGGMSFESSTGALKETGHYNGDGPADFIGFVWDISVNAYMVVYGEPPKYGLMYAFVCSLFSKELPYKDTRLKRESKSDKWVRFEKKFRKAYQDMCHKHYNFFGTPREWMRREYEREWDRDCSMFELEGAINFVCRSDIQHVFPNSYRISNHLTVKRTLIEVSKLELDFPTRKQ